MRMSSAAILLCTVLGAGASLDAQQTSASSEKIHSHMLRLIRERGPAKGWVFFKDKGVAGPKAMRRELWRARLPAGGQATPMTYRLRPDGRQYVVIAAGGHGSLGTRQGDALVAFALP